MAYEPTLVHLPGTVLTPEVVLHRTLDKVEHIKSVVVVVQWQDSTFDVDFSTMLAGTLAMSALVVEKAAVDIAFQPSACASTDA